MKNSSLLWLIYLSRTWAVDVSKMRTIQSKVRIAITKSNQRENQLNVNTLRQPKAFLHPDPSTDRNKLNASSTLEVFTRKRNTGHWIFYEVIEVDPSLYDEYISTKTMMPEEDPYLNPVNLKVLSLHYGDGLGGEQSFSKRVKQKLPQFRKLKPKDMEYGYQFIGNEVIIPLITKSRAMEHKESLRKLPPPKEDIETQLLEYATACEDSYRRWIHDIQNSFIENNSSVCILSSDGSASMEGPDCLRATSSVCIKTGSSDLPAYSLLIHGIESISGTAFDAELMGGLAAAVVANELAEPWEGPLTLLTDSRTLTRAIRTGPTGELATRGSSSRRLVWELLHGLVCRLPSERLCWEWVAGHPERATEDRSRWLNSI